ncbi:FAD-dependent oxidoreductase [Pelagicoccus sp. SDUM812005]|uniref:FAD-dependent oxidoreductase n=1 Tax=Pelagicoccus sp. SDUM812005 TaxID=3041257 RepID=UPI00280D367A|nr:FAD-dependent oxidoreductase [Pelagicoccus sp. SDUM812005]MDQ8180519.1 FAD-dependent oxidoreductase [Pelagicoccus sp. SDUM812005]
MTKDSTGPSVAVFGGGIAGLTCAHELAKRGYAVSVYEANSESGGFFRSSRDEKGMPTEYSWHGLGPWYHNAFDLLRDIPWDQDRSVYDHALSRPIDFGIFPEKSHSRFYSGLLSIPHMVGFSKRDAIRWLWLMLKTWTANERTEQRYSRLNAAEQWKPKLSRTAHLWWRSCFGPWIGSDWKNASLHHAGQFFRKQLVTQPTYQHPADEDGQAWSHGQRDGWLLFRGPSSEYWFAPWERHLESLGVRLFLDARLEELSLTDGKIERATLASGEGIEADYFVLAINPFAAADVIQRSPELAKLEQLRLFKPLTADGPHVQVSFRLAFAEPVRLPRERMAAVVADSEFNLTVFAQEQAWHKDVSLGKGVQSLWTGTSCVSSQPGRLFGLSVERCSRKEFEEEVKSQLFSCESLNQLVREANHGRDLKDFELLEFEVWHEWDFSGETIRSPQPKWVTTTNTQPYLPEQRTPLPNLFLAGAHTRTEADVWSIEGAVESGRRAARGIDPMVPLKRQYRPIWMKALGKVDDLCFRCRLPHLLDCGRVVLAASAAGAALWFALR